MSEKDLKQVEEVAGQYLEAAAKSVAEHQDEIKQHFNAKIKVLEEVRDQRVADVERDVERVTAVGEKLSSVAKSVVEKIGRFDMSKLIKRVKRYYQLTPAQIADLYVEYDELKAADELDYYERWNKIDTKAAKLIEAAGLKVDFTITAVPPTDNEDNMDDDVDDEDDMDDEDE